ncbi:MAG: excinuclease ABC subunit UvrC [Spirochaetaceae bacterium]|nr:MAG: excinuclease ABC subunit UvrC [Spirochaetaceae bacterium]
MKHGTTPAFSPRESTENLPTGCGVYLMKAPDETIIYVGKAKNLKSRVKSYFSGRKDPKTAVLMQRVARIDYLVTRNEYEALLLENNLIKKWKPRYNINLKDGKTYPVIRITGEEYPRVFRTRTIVQDGSDYFGPFPSVDSIERYLELAERLYPLRKCRGPLRRREHPCLYHHIGRCSAPCCGRISREEYLEHVDGVRRLLNGETHTLRADLERSMRHASQEHRFEQAAEYRDLIRAIDTLETEQQVVDFDPDTRDYVAFAAEDDMCSFVVFQMRAGRLLASDMFRTSVFASETEDLEQFIVRYYDSRNTAPSALYLPLHVPSKEITRFFAQEHAANVTIEVPQGGRHASILAMARENALQDLERRKRETGNLPALRELAAVLQLRQPPLRIEGFDVAHIGGRFTVASMVSFSNGVPDRAQYRHYRIRSLNGAIDDFEAMREVIARRYQRVVNERLPRPDLILIDGGKGQLNAASEVLDGIGLGHIPLVGLAKRLEEIFVPGQSDALTLPEGSPPLRLLQYVRDEAHRFATSFRAGLQSKDVSRSLLEQIPGIGPKRSRRILQAFDSLEVLAETPTDVIVKTCGVRTETAEAIQELLRRHTTAYGGELSAAERATHDYRGSDTLTDGVDQAP